MSIIGCVATTAGSVFVGAVLGFAYDIYWTDLSNMDDVRGVYSSIRTGALLGGLTGLFFNSIMLASF